MHQLLSYFRYFFYLSINFNPLLALLMLYDDIRGERKYKLRTTGVKETYKLKLTGIDTTNAFEYMPSNYVLLERVFNEVNTYPHNQTFLDIGCGKGRVLLVAAHFGFQKLYGVELIPGYCQRLQTLIKEKAILFPSASFDVSCNDAAAYAIPADVQVLFFYNPFNEIVMRKVIGNILKSVAHARRPLYLIYLNPLYKPLFLQSGFTELYGTSRFGYLTASLLRLE